MYRMAFNSPGCKNEVVICWRSSIYNQNTIISVADRMENDDKVDGRDIKEISVTNPS